MTFPPRSPFSDPPPSQPPHEALPGTRSLPTIRPLLSGYATYLFTHLLTAPWLILRGITARHKRGYAGLEWQRLQGGIAPPSRGHWSVLITTSIGETRTGLQAAKEIAAGEQIPVALWVGMTEAYRYAARQTPDRAISPAPFNNPISALIALHRWRPSSLLFVEYTDLHHLVFVARLLRIPTATINVRLVEADTRRQKRSRMRTWRVRAMTSYAVQSEEPRTLLESLGVERNRIVVSGPSLAIRLAHQEERQAARKRWEAYLKNGTARPVIVAGSSHAPDEAALWPAFARLLQSRPDTMLIIAPRNMPRCAEVKAMAQTQGWRVALRSEEPDHVPAETSVLVLDTMGELADVYSAADAALVGGSFSPTEGAHTPVEALAWGVPLVMGPDQTAQEALAALLEREGMLTICVDSTELFDALQRAVTLPKNRQEAEAHAHALIQRYSDIFARFHHDLMQRTSASSSLETPARPTHTSR